MMNAPISVPITVPSPPVRLPPPITTAAITWSSYVTPAVGWPVISRDVSIIPAKPVSKPQMA